MSSNKIFEVYLHCCKASGKGYVGITCRGVKQRLYSHESEARHGSNKPFARAIRKYGIAAFETTILAQGLTEKEALDAEQHFIDKLGTFGPGGYNATKGGEGTRGMKLSEQRKAEISDHFKKMPRTERHRARVSAALKGRLMKPEAVEKTAAKIRGRKQPPAEAAKSRENLAKGLAVWTGMKHSGDAKRRMRQAKARVLMIQWPEGRKTIERTTYRDLAEKHGISHSAIAASVKLGRVISKECGLKGCKITLLSNSALSMEDYKKELASPFGVFSSCPFRQRSNPSRIELLLPC